MEKQTETEPKKRVWPFWAVGTLALLAVTAALAKFIGWPLGNAKTQSEKPTPTA